MDTAEAMAETEEGMVDIMDSDPLFVDAGVQANPCRRNARTQAKPSVKSKGE